MITATAPTYVSPDLDHYEKHYHQLCGGERHSTLQVCKELDYQLMLSNKTVTNIPCDCYTYLICNDLHNPLNVQIDLIPITCV